MQFKDAIEAWKKHNITKQYSEQVKKCSLPMPKLTRLFLGEIELSSEEKSHMEGCHICRNRLDFLKNTSEAE